MKGSFWFLKIFENEFSFIELLSLILFSEFNFLFFMTLFFNLFAKFNSTFLWINNSFSKEEIWAFNVLIFSSNSPIFCDWNSIWVINSLFCNIVNLSLTFIYWIFNLVTFLCVSFKFSNILLFNSLYLISLFICWVLNLFSLSIFNFSFFSFNSFISSLSILFSSSIWFIISILWLKISLLFLFNASSFSLNNFKFSISFSNNFCSL